MYMPYMLSELAVGPLHLKKGWKIQVLDTYISVKIDISTIEVFNYTADR